jgi:membrane AbrB-like protein
VRGMAWPLLIVITLPVTALLLWLHAPAALMLGPLVAAMVFASSGGKVQLPVSISVVAQGIVGCMIAKMVPLSIVGDVLDHWKLFTFGVLSVVAASSFLGWLMTRLQWLPGTTALWGCSPGAASVMTFMAEDYGADMQLVAFMQYSRVVLVAAIAAVVAKLSGATSVHHPAEVVWFPPVAWLSLGETLALAILGPVLARVLRIPAGAFLVPLVGGVVLTHFGWVTIELPTWLLALSYAVVGWNVGLRFSKPLLLHAARLLPRMLVSTLALIVLCGGLAAVMVVVAGIDPMTAYLATSPGGSDSIAIIAASSDVDISFVMAMQTVRMIGVMFLAPVLTRFIAKRLLAPPGG